MAAFTFHHLHSDHSHVHHALFTRSRVLAWLLAAAVLILVGVILGMPSKTSGQAPLTDTALTPVFVLPIDPTFSP